VQTGTIYCFGDFEIQTDEQRLLVGGAPIALGARAFNLLLVLAARAGQLVSKDSLLEQVWPDVVVEENNLQVQVSSLRKLLGAEAIATVVGKGYRFTPEVSIRTAGLARAATPASSSHYRHSNLPHHLSELIGREETLAQLQSVLSSSRLITVTGAGGVGKTRLMIACAQAVETQFSEGARLIELANLSDAQMVAATVAAHLGLEVKDATSATSLISHFVRDKQMLLLLDNCEHLVDAVAAFIDALLAVAPQLQIMSTSQDILGLTGEQVFRVPSLQVPETTPTSAEDAIAYGAVRLFAERVKSADPSFQCTDDNVSEIVAICRRLDGIPLAIEMAAARISTLGLHNVARLLDERFLALAAGRRTAIPRQRTLQATLDWSYGLLSERERIVFRRLAGFVGGFSLAAAIAVGADDALDQNEVIDLVSVLVSKSLLTVNTSQGQWRYRLLEVARVYALERLAESGESTQVARRAAEHYVHVFDACFDDWTRLSDEVFDARYAPDLENVCLSLDWAFGAEGDPQIGLDLTGKSGHLWVGRLMIAESRQRIATAFSHIDAHTPPALEAHVQLIAGIFFYWREWERSIAALRIAAPMLQDLGESDAAGYALLTLGNNIILSGIDDPTDTLNKANALLENSNRLRLMTLMRKTVGMHHYLQGRVAEADVATRQALALANVGGFEIVAITLEENLVDAMWLSGDLPNALMAAREVVEKCKRVQVPGKIIWNWIYGNLFGILVESGELEEAAEIGRLTMSYLREANAPWKRMDHYALYQTKIGNFTEAALVLGWITHYFESKGISHQPNEVRARNEVASTLLARLGAEVLASLRARGAQLSEHEVCRLAVGV
jgi:predicted ATPase/DNA-binding winged helix-turn-helix (wHTH) protein